MKAPTGPPLLLREFTDTDEAEVLDLLRITLGEGPTGSRTPAFFRWKHAASPFGPSYLLVAEAEGRIVGLRAFMRWRLMTGDRSLRAVIAVDTATHPDFQGRGIFSRLTKEAVTAFGDEVDLVFNTPNDKSLPGYLKMGWHVVGKVPVLARIRRPIRFATRARSFRTIASPGDRPRIAAAPAGTSLEDSGSTAALLAETAPTDPRLATPRDLTYLRWRYADAPELDYRTVSVHERGELRGLAFFRVRPRGRLWESTIDDLIVRPGDRATARRLLSRVARSANVDLLTCHFPRGWAAAAAARRAGFIKAPVGITLAARPLREGIHPDPTVLASWALSLGDLEVF